MKLNIKKQHLIIIYVVSNLLKARTSASIADIINDEEEDECMAEVEFSIKEFRDVYYALSNIAEGVMSTVNNEMKGYLIGQLLLGTGLDLNQLMFYRSEAEENDESVYYGYKPLRQLPEDYEPTEDNMEFIKLLDCMIEIDNENINRLNAMFKSGRYLAKND